MPKANDITGPHITRVKGLQTVEIGGAPKLVEEFVSLDYGPGRGTSKVYVMTEPDKQVDWAMLNSILRRYGLEVDR